MAQDAEAAAGASEAKFELVEGATFQLSDGSTVTVRDGQLELADGRRLPMPAAGETITVERTVPRPDGGTTRIRHTIRLSEAAAPAAAGAPPPDQGGAPAPEGKASAPENAEEGGAEGSEKAPGKTALAEADGPPEAPGEDQPSAPIVPKEPVVMGLNCGRRSLRAMLWGSIPEGSLGDEDEDEVPKDSSKSLLNPQHSIKEVEEESQHDDEEPYQEALEASENADESFEFEDGKDSKPRDFQRPHLIPFPNDNPVTKVTVLAFDMPPPAEKAETLPDKAEERKESNEEEPSGVTKSDLPNPPLHKPTKPTWSAGGESLEETNDKTPPEPTEHAEPEHHEKRHLTRQDKLPSSTRLADDAAAVMVGVLTYDEAPTAEPSRPAASTPARRGGDIGPGGAAAASPRRDEAQHELELKLTPILRSLESEKPKDAARPEPTEDRKGTVPPNTPAVTEEREPATGRDDSPPEPAYVSVPKVVSYYENISPAKQGEAPAPLRVRPAEPRQAETTVPKIVNFAVPMQPQKVYIGGQEPEEMENTPIPRRGEPARVATAPEPAAGRQQPRQTLVTVRGTPADRHPLSGPAERQTDRQPEPQSQAETEQQPQTEPKNEPETEPESQMEPQPEPKPEKTAPVYNPALFEPEPKRPLVLSSEVTEEPTPPYEPGVHDARTLPLGRRPDGAVTDQPPPFDERSDPTDPFLPHEQQPAKQSDWLSSCLDLCCCCWAP